MFWTLHSSFSRTNFQDIHGRTEGHASEVITLGKVALSHEHEFFPKRSERYFALLFWEQTLYHLHDVLFTRTTPKRVFQF